MKTSGAGEVPFGRSRQRYRSELSEIAGRRHLRARLVRHADVGIEVLDRFGAVKPFRSRSNFFLILSTRAPIFRSPCRSLMLGEHVAGQPGLDVAQQRFGSTIAGSPSSPAILSRTAKRASQ